ncbi:MAG: (2Fe-2S)-binding protein [Planctomycetales bacterium]|nr:(2Fe-2S)-binding protein [Planctomycetales bacterium]
MSQPTKGFSRRAFLRGSGVAAAASSVTSTQSASAAIVPVPIIAGETQVSLTVNGQKKTVTVEPRTTLLDTLRYQLNLTGAKPVSSDGSSGASTVLVDGKPVMASTTLTVAVSGKSISTCEGLKDGDIPKAFVSNDAQQCGFCTPGFVVAVKAFLNQHPDATEEQIRAGLNGNICRCGTYANVLQAVIALVKGNQNG